MKQEIDQRDGKAHEEDPAQTEDEDLRVLE
jgi:hypothetical protein